MSQEGEKESGFLNAQTLYANQWKLQGLGLLQSSSECYTDFRCGLQDELLVKEPDLSNTTYRRAQALATTRWASLPHILLKD